MNVLRNEQHRVGPPSIQRRLYSAVMEKHRPASYPYGPESGVNTKHRIESASSFLLTMLDFDGGVGLCDGYLKRYSDPVADTAMFHRIANINTNTRSFEKQTKRLEVKPFSNESLDRIEYKTNKLLREFHLNARRKLSIDDGSRLPSTYEPFPKMLYGRPLEEIDTFIYDETFCVISKRFHKNYIHRFNASNSFFVFSPWSSYRKICIYLSTNQFFDYLVMATILLNCVFLAMAETIEEAEYIFLAIYTAEMIIKSIAKGFILQKYTYLRNPWNWLDFVVITSGYATIGMDIGNLAGLRTFRVLRALKTISILPETNVNPAQVVERPDRREHRVYVGVDDADIVVIIETVGEMLVAAV